LEFVITVSDRAWGGKQQYMLDVAAGLRSRGHAATLVALRDGRFAARAEKAGLVVAELTSFAETGLLADVIAKAGPAPVVVASGRQDAAACTIVGRKTKYQGLRVLVRHSAFPLSDGPEADYARCCDLIICTSEYQRKAQFASVPSDRLAVVPSAVDGSRFEAAAAAVRQRAQDRLDGTVPADEIRVLSLARLEWEKGVDTVIRAVAEVRKRHPGLVLMIAGDGRERARLEAEARRLGVEAGVLFLGEVPDPPMILGQADVSVLATTVPETGPLALKEAMAAGHAVVARRIGGIPEFVANGATGFLFDEEHELAESLERLVSEPGTAAALGSAAQLKVMSEHRLEARMQTFARTLERLAIRKLPVEIAAENLRHCDVRLRDDPSGPFLFCGRSSALRRVSALELATLSRMLGPDGAVRRADPAESMRNCLLMLHDMQGINSP
jgi:glycosyltransferase involved in cell wall biosynthesis